MSIQRFESQAILINPDSARAGRQFAIEAAPEQDFAAGRGS